MFVDTHCHLNIIAKKEFESTLSQEHILKIRDIIDQATNAEVCKIINIGTSLQESKNTIQIAQQFENVFATVGLHPCDCKENWKEEFQAIVKLVENKKENKIVGIGEVGLDFYHKPFNRQRQEDAFKYHIELALEQQLPLVVHVREASDELLTVLEEYSKDLNAVIHCFNHPQDFANTVLEWGFYIGIDGPITYPKNDIFRKIVKNIPLNKILLETDAPFLPPQQFRGKQNVPAYIPIIAQTVADIKQVSLDEIAQTTTETAEKFFGI